MPNNYNFLDAAQSVLTARSSITAGSAMEPYVIISSMPAITVTPPANQSVSGTVNIGTLPNASVSGTVNIGTLPNASVSGTVSAQQTGTWISSVISSNPSSLLTGTYAQRNDAVASFLGGDKTWNPVATDSAGRTLNKPFAAEESRVEGYISLTSTSVTTLVAAAGAGLRNYITDIWLANTGAAATLVTFSSGGGNSILGYTIVPAGSGSNLQGLQTPIRTLANETFGIQPATATSTLYATVKGFKAP